MCSIRLCRKSLTDTRRAEWNRARKRFYFFFFIATWKNDEVEQLWASGQQFKERKAQFICVPCACFFFFCSGGKARLR